MKKKLLKTFLLLALLLGLTGCDFKFRTFTAIQVCFVPMLDVKTFDTLMTEFGLWLVRVVSGPIVAMQRMMYNTLQTNFNDTMNFLEAMGGTFGRVVTVASILSAVAIAVCFAISVFKQNMYEQNRDMAPDGLTRMKKLLTAVIVAFAFPYLASTSYIASSYLGTKVATVIAYDVLGNDATNFMIYDEMDRNGLDFTTYCSVGQENTKVGGNLSILRTEGKNVSLLTPENANNFQLSSEFLQYHKEFEGVDMYDFWCGGGNGADRNKALNIYTSLFVKGKPFENVAIFSSPDMNLIDALLMFVNMAFVSIASLFALITTAMRVVELVFTIGMSWWYIGNSVGDFQGRSMGALMRKLVSICLTQFIFMLEFGILCTIVMTGFFQETIILTLGKLSLTIACVFVMLGTPAAIQELVRDTGLSLSIMKRLTK